jgi:hypothetical protein
MTIRRTLTGFVGIAALAALSASSAHALSISVASTADDLNGATAETFTGGPGGTLYIPSSGTSVIPVNLTISPTTTYDDIDFSFTPTSATSAAVLIPFSGGKYAEEFTGGTFDFYSGTTTYLSGTYTTGVMSAAQGGTTVQFQSGGANEVTYTGGTVLGLEGLSPGDIGAFGLSFSGTDNGSGTGTSLSGGHIDQFTGNGLSGTFSAFVPNAVPEPSSTAAFAVSALVLAGLVIRKRSSSSLAL